MTTPRLATIAATLLAAAALAGCAGSTSPSRPPAHAAGDPQRVEVWEGQEPAHAYVEAGELWARTISKPGTIERLKKEAARFYMDGIHSVECKGPTHGECTGVGFVYQANHGVAGVAEAPVAPTARTREVASR